MSQNKGMDFTELKRVFKALIFRNSVMLTDVNQKLTPHEVNLHWWKHKCQSSREEDYNLGDYLSTIVYDYMLKYYHIN